MEYRFCASRFTYGIFHQPKEGALLPIRKPKDPGNEGAKYEEIDRTHVDVSAEWRVILL